MCPPHPHHPPDVFLRVQGLKWRLCARRCWSGEWTEAKWAAAGSWGDPNRDGNSICGPICIHKACFSPKEKTRDIWGKYHFLPINPAEPCLSWTVILTVAFFINICQHQPVLVFIPCFWNKTHIICLSQGFLDTTPRKEKNDFLLPPLVCSHSDHKLKESKLSLYVKSDTQTASPANAVQFCPTVVPSPGSDLYFCPNNNGWLIRSWSLTLPLFRCSNHILSVDSSFSRSGQRWSNLWKSLLWFCQNLCQGWSLCTGKLLL